MNYPLFIFSLLLISCNSPTADAEKPLDTPINTDSLILPPLSDTVPVEKKTITKKTCPIDSILLSFVVLLEEQDWWADTARLKKVKSYSALNHAKMTLFERPFYPIPFDKSCIYRSNEWEPLSKTPIDFKLFASAEQIWAYFYRKLPAESTNPDGIIEQWTFSNHTQAKKAYQQLRETRPGVLIINCPLYFSLKGKNVFFFHGGSM